LTAESKLDEAKFFFKKMLKIKDNYSEWRYYFSAFLCSVRSIPYHLLYDYAKKIDIGLYLNDYIDSKIFRKKALEQNKQDALSFVDWYNKKLIEFLKKNVVEAIIKSRNIDIHRNIAPLESFASLSANFTISDRVKFDSRDNEGRDTRRDKINKKSALPSSDLIEVKPYLPELPGVNVHDACKESLRLMRIFIDEIHQKFP